MPTVATKLYKKLLIIFSLPILLAEYFRSATGKEYGIGFMKKARLAFKMYRNTKWIPTASSCLEHLVMATEIMRLPRTVLGSVVECGSYKGGSAANLSLVCALCDRRLEIFDSFCGLPSPSDDDKAHAVLVRREVHTYSQGAYSGSTEEVKHNVSRWGELEVCTLHPGRFEVTLRGYEGRCVLLFLDVDLIDSLRTCLLYLWPLLQDGCYCFTHEAHHMEMARVFFDETWWRGGLNSSPPGLVGAGTGLGLAPVAGGFSSPLGYAVKNPKLETFAHLTQTGSRSSSALP